MENQPLNYPAFNKAAEAFKEVDGTTLFDHLADKKPEESGETKVVTRDSLLASVTADEAFGKLADVQKDLIVSFIQQVNESQLALAQATIVVTLHGSDKQKDDYRLKILAMDDKRTIATRNSLLTILGFTNTDAPKAGA